MQCGDAIAQILLQKPDNTSCIRIDDIEDTDQLSAPDIVVGSPVDDEPLIIDGDVDATPLASAPNERKPPPASLPKTFTGPEPNKHVSHQKLSVPTPKQEGDATGNPSDLKFMLFDMREYTDDCCSTFSKVTGIIKFKKASTPFLSDSSLDKADDDAKGQLGVHSSKRTMKVLWLARLARPDVVKANQSQQLVTQR